ncbi:MAG: U32 family peptidase C-terminal domain-containing protein [Lachnospira eligens]
MYQGIHISWYRGDTNEQGLYHIEQQNKFSVGETIEVMKPDGQNIEVTVKRIVDENGKDMDSCPHLSRISILI